jgi:hypothetical protein
VGLSDKLRVSRFKTFCPRCEEVYVPKTSRSVTIDGAYFGTALPHTFMLHFPMAIILPPKTFFYEPKIAGFKIHAKRGSKAFEPPKGNVRIIEDSMQSLELEQLVDSMCKPKSPRGRTMKRQGKQDRAQ